MKLRLNENNYKRICPDDKNLFNNKNYSSNKNLLVSQWWFRKYRISDELTSFRETFLTA